MKITSPLIISALIAIFVILSCSKDESGPDHVDPEPELTFTVEDKNGNIFDDNQTLDFSSLNYPDASLDFLVRNISSEIIGMRIEVESITGTDGSMMELCFGQCFAGVEQGFSYPSNNAEPVVFINPGQTQTSSGDHFFNTDPGNGSDPVEYTFKFYNASESGEQVGGEFRLKYRYSQN